MRTLERRQERMRYSEQPQEIDGEMLFDYFEIGQIVVNRDAGIVNEDIERTDLLDCLLDLRSVGHVQGHGCHAFVGDLQWAASTRVNPLCPASKRFIHQRPPDAAAGAGDQDCLVLNVHTVLLCPMSVFVSFSMACSFVAM